MTNTLKDKVAYITGGSKGIGYGIAKTLLDNGMRVAITSRNLSAAKQAAESLTRRCFQDIGFGIRCKFYGFRN